MSSFLCVTFCDVLALLRSVFTLSLLGNNKLQN